MDLSIVIVSWKVKDRLRQCLTSIQDNRGGLQLEIFVVDNASNDGSAEMVSQQFPEVKLLVNHRNRGFAAANNQAIKLSQGRYVLLLNPDTEIIDNALEKMVSFMNQHEDSGIAGCQLLNSDRTIQPSVRHFPTTTALLLLFTKLAKLMPRQPALRHYFAAGFDYTSASPVDQVMGSFFLIRQQLINQLGRLDERFYIWFEEVDYCKRAKQAGWEVWYTPSAKIIHHGGQSFQRSLLIKKQLIFFKSAWRYLQKHGSG